MLIFYLPTFIGSAICWQKKGKEQKKIVQMSDFYVWCGERKVIPDNK